MRYRIKLTVVAEKDGKVHTFCKYFRRANPHKAYLAQSNYLRELEEDGYDIRTEVSVGGWVS